MATRRLIALMVPGLVIQSVVVGGGYATGRELVEFYLSAGIATGLVGIIITTLVFSLCAMATFELARLFQAFDYRHLSRIYLGPFWRAFEIVYLCSLVLVLSVVSAGSAELLESRFTISPLVGSTIFMMIVAALVHNGSKTVERSGAAFSVIFYIVYGVFIALTLVSFRDNIAHAFNLTTVHWRTSAWNGVSYAGYNVPILAILVFVARGFKTRSESLISGALVGPIVMAPAIALLLALSALYPGILKEPLPVTTVLNSLDARWLSPIMDLVLYGALVSTGVGVLHGLNERIAGVYDDLDLTMPKLLRPGLALAVSSAAIFAATAIGLVTLIAKGYRALSLFYVLLYITPLFTYGLWRILAHDSRQKM